MPQAEMCTRCGFIVNLICNLKHDFLNMAHMCRNMSGQDLPYNVWTGCAFVRINTYGAVQNLLLLHGAYLNVFLFPTIRKMWSPMRRLLHTPLHVVQLCYTNLHLDYVINV